MQIARLSYLTQGSMRHAFSITLIETDNIAALEHATGLIARIENLSTGVEFYLGAFCSERRAIEGVFAQINGLIDHPYLHSLIAYRLE